MKQEVWIRTTRQGEYALKFNYSEFIRKQIAQIPGRKFNLKTNLWYIPYSEEALIELSIRIGIEQLCSDELEIRMILERIKPHIQIRLDAEANEQWIQKADQDLLLRNYSSRTRKVYTNHIRRFASFIQKPLTLAEFADIRNYLLKEINEKQQSASFINQFVSALKFLFDTTLHRNDLSVQIPRAKKEKKLPCVLSVSEIGALLTNVRNLKHKCLIFELLPFYWTGQSVSFRSHTSSNFHFWINQLSSLTPFASNRIVS